MNTYDIAFQAQRLESLTMAIADAVIKHLCAKTGKPMPLEDKFQLKQTIKNSIEEYWES